MKKTATTILAAAVTGLFMGGTMTGCASGETTMTAAEMGLEKHACKGMNTCEGQGGCTTATNDCAGKNACEGMGGCATVAHHDCGGKNSCEGLGGCATPDHDCAGKNACEGQGGCHVPVEKK